MLHRLANGLAAALLLAALSCGDGAGPEAQVPVPGTLLVNVSPPTQTSGALLVRVTSDSPRTVKFQSTHYDLRVFTRQATDQEVRVIVVGVIRYPATTIAITVSDVSELSAYQATVLEGSSSDGELIPGTAYGVSVTKATGPVNLRRLEEPAAAVSNRQ